MNRTELLLSPSPQPLDLPGGRRLWVRVPTAGDVIEADGKGLGWQLVRWLCNEDGSPVFREGEEEQAERMPAWIATRVVEKAGQLMQAPPDSGQAAADAPGPQAWQECGGDGEADCDGALTLAAVG
jgi:hypothetical protein